MSDIEKINPLVDDWDTGMIAKFSNEQLINALHDSLDRLYDAAEIKGLGRLTRLFFNSIIIEIKKRMLVEKLGDLIINLLKEDENLFQYVGDWFYDNCPYFDDCAQNAIENYEPSGNEGHI
ncbi:MAG: hypothetical protein ACFFCM_22460 [Promethearchaeota archaeon]